MALWHASNMALWLHRKLSCQLSVFLAFWLAIMLAIWLSVLPALWLYSFMAAAPARLKTANQPQSPGSRQKPKAAAAVP